jgi:hypothetical protein
MAAVWPRAAALALIAAACSRSEGPRQVVSTSPRIVPGLGASPLVPTTDSTDPDPAALAPVVPQHDPVVFDGAPLSYIVMEKLDAAAAPVVDPDQAIVQAARVSASACFAGLQGGPDVQSAILEVTVVPSGRVSRATAHASSSVPEVLDCLTRVGNALQFSSKEDSKSEGIRSFSIDVTVARPH